MNLFTYMQIHFDVRWLISDSEQEIDKRLILLLAIISPVGSLQKAADEIGISYRTAWEIIRQGNILFGSPLCTMERGKGTKLTSLGQKLIETKQIIESKYIDDLHNAADEFNKTIDELIGQNNRKLTAFSSHDLAISFFQEISEQKNNLEIDFNSRGSLDALKQLQVSKYNIAGFHFPEGDFAKQLTPEYKQLLNDEKHLFIHLATRQQGLILKPSLSDHIKNIKGITRRSIKFINRQKGSGTRAIFDQMLKLNEINKKDINGYNKEEFTHTAVAAMISSGQADVGFGLKAAAAQFNLSFLPLITENYVIALNKSLPDNLKRNIRNMLKDDSLKRKINRLPGYDATLTGKIIHANKMLMPERTSE